MNMVETLDGKIHTVMDDPHYFSELVGEYMGSDAKKFYEETVEEYEHWMDMVSIETADNLCDSILSVANDMENLESDLDDENAKKLRAIKEHLEEVVNRWDSIFGISEMYNGIKCY